MSGKANEVKTVEELYLHIKSTIRQSFARLYAAVKARELQTLRQLQAVHSHCESSHAHLLACLQSINISYDVEPKILENISHFGEVKLDGVNFDGDAFLVEDYVNPNEDHMYFYKDIDDVSDKTEHLTLDIEEAALRQITKTENCVCSVNITSEEVHKIFNDNDTPKKLLEIISIEKRKLSLDNKQYENEGSIIISDAIAKSDCNNDLGSDIKKSDDSAKTNPTDEWLNCIKTQTEIEPTQANDVMEHSKIKC